MQTTSNGRPPRRSSRSASSTSNHQTEDRIDTGASDNLEGKYVVTYEEWVASEENIVAQVEVNKVKMDTDDIAGSQMSNQDIFAEDNVTVNVSGSNDVDISQSIETKINADIADSLNDKIVGKVDSDTLDESSEQHQADNLFEKLGFAALTEPSAEEMFDEMIRSSTPNASQKSNDTRSSDDTAPESNILSTENESKETEGVSDTNTKMEVYIFNHASSNVNCNCYLILKYTKDNP